MEVLDLSGLYCPRVVLRLADRMCAMLAGSLLKVISTDPLSDIDIPLYLRRQKHELVERLPGPSEVAFVVRKGRERRGS